ncbi:MAG TPA: CpsB/CapC family capsule biosynthesis tyrosine phosphatase [Gaiellaceae bacterium]|nr:CpsB/CapC family capsule biosynthesis tyrosine phosphatase [Gaiellaceae bacterium]
MGTVDAVRGFVDVHSHVVPSGDDGVHSLADGLALCREAARRGTAVLFATPHVWPELPLLPAREEEVRAAHAELAPLAAEEGVDLRLGWELTPAPGLLDEDMARYRLGDLPAVLMEVPFHGSLALADALAEHVEACGLTPVIAHPERAEAVAEDPGAAERLRGNGRLLQLNATSLLGYHGPEIEASAWRLVDAGLADLVASDGHRAARPPFLDEAFELVRARVGGRATSLFDGRALPGLARADGLDLAQRR